MSCRNTSLAPFLSCLNVYGRHKRQCGSGEANTFRNGFEEDTERAIVELFLLAISQACSKTRVFHVAVLPSSPTDDGWRSENPVVVFADSHMPNQDFYVPLTDLYQLPMAQ
jgi:hypothetical protein